MRFSDAPGGMAHPGGADKVMHAQLRIGGAELLASDGMGEGGTPFSGILLSLGVPSVDEGRRLFTALAVGGKVTMPFEKTFWTEGFGHVTDRFGVAWMVNVAH